MTIILNMVESVKVTRGSYVTKEQIFSLRSLSLKVNDDFCPLHFGPFYCTIPFGTKRFCISFAVILTFIKARPILVATQGLMSYGGGDGDRKMQRKEIRAKVLPSEAEGEKVWISRAWEEVRLFSREAQELIELNSGGE